MNNDYTDITVVLDRSGSMSTIQHDMEGGLNTLFNDQKKLPGKCLASLYQFDDTYETVFEATTIKDVPTIVLEPRGSTALLDAIGRTITGLGNRLALLPEVERPGKVIFIIVTDGMENASKEYQKSKINELITRQREYKWEFVFLGANQDALQEAHALGIDVRSAMTFQASAAGVQASSGSLSRNIGSYRVGTMQDMSFSDEDRKAQEIK